MSCIVLSGTTVPFTALVEAFNDALIQKLEQYGFQNIYIQHGHAQLPAVTRSSVMAFSFNPEIKQLVQTTQLVISHAGSGSILDSVERGHGVATRKVIVVVNNDLMDNHQLELARKLEKEGCVLVASDPSKLPDTIDAVMRRQVAKLTFPSSIQHVVDEEMHSV